jgi:hypothetical protein
VRLGGWAENNSQVGTGNTYTYSVKDPRSDRERYMRVALTDLFTKSEPLDSGEVRSKEDEQDGDYSRSTYRNFRQSGFGQM